MFFLIDCTCSLFLHLNKSRFTHAQFSILMLIRNYERKGSFVSPSIEMFDLEFSSLSASHFWYYLYLFRNSMQISNKYYLLEFKYISCFYTNGINISIKCK